MELQTIVNEFIAALEDYKKHRYDPKHFEDGKPFNFNKMFEEIEVNNTRQQRIRIAFNCLQQFNC